jgi:hypothetical protein
VLDAELPLASDAYVEQGMLVTLGGSYVSGTLTGPRGSLPFNALFVDYGFTYAGSVVSVALLAPMSSPSNLEAASADVQAQAEAIGRPKVGCYNPNWVGHEGVPCCGFFTAYLLKVQACRHARNAAMLLCFGGIGGGGVGAVAACVKLCIVFTASNPACIGGCIIGGGAIVVSSLVFCLLSADEAYHACLDNEAANYVNTLALNGCYPAPEGFGP